MFTREKYCAVCGCLFSLPLLRNPENPDPNEDETLALNDPYDSRVLPRHLTTVICPNAQCSEDANEASSGSRTFAWSVDGETRKRGSELKRNCN